MEHSESSCAKRARHLSRNQIREIIMDSDSDEEQYDTSGTEDEEMEPRPPSRKSHTEIFDSPLSGRCWQGLGMNPDHPGL